MKPQIPPFGDGVVLLRPIAEADLETTLAWRNRDDARIWFKTSDVLSLDQHRGWFRAYLAKSDDLHFIVERDGKLVGQAAVYRCRDGRAEIGRFLVAPEAAGSGAMARACSALLEFCARPPLSLKSVYLEVFAHNERALDLYRRLGFHESGREGGLLRMERDLA